MVDVRGDVLRPPHGTTPAAVKSNKNQKFHLYPPWDGGTKVCSNGPGHMTNMAVMPIYGKNL